MSAEQDHYSILGVSSASEQVVIQAAYRALMRQYHPDTNPSSDAAIKAQRINAAYAILGDPGKRASYDAAQNAKKRSSDSTSSSQSPPPPPKQKAAPPQSPPPASPKSKKLAAGFSITSLALLTGAIVIANSQASESADNTMNVDTIEANSIVTADSFDYTVDADETVTLTASNVDANMTGGPGLDDIFGNAAEVESKPLRSQPAQALRFADVEAGANKFAELLMKSGISGARAYSEKCHAQVSVAPNWGEADRCAAFDYAASFVDHAINREAGFPTSSYFAFQSENQEDQYEEAGAYRFTLNSRLSAIRRAAEPIAKAALNDAIARESRKLDRTDAREDINASSGPD